jgi:dTDP-4-dehydrorhamnose reductase
MVMKVLITGANGQLGQDIQKLFRKKTIDYIAPGSKTLDISDRMAVSRFVADNPVDVIINCAAYNAVDLAETEWKKAFAVNGLGVRNLAIAANKSGAVLLHYSSDYVFDGLSGNPYTVADSPNPICNYGRSKLLGEQCIGDLADQFILIRTSWVFGAGNENFPKKIISWSRDKAELKVVTDQVASPTYTVDLAQATLDLIENKAFGLYHITNSGYCSRYEWAKYILDQIGWTGNLIPASSEEFPTAARRPPFSVLDNFGSSQTIGDDLPDWRDATRRFLKEMDLIP